jgi:hypothetical protein
MRKRPNPDSEPNIRRIDSKSKAKKQTHGFQVHFLRGDQSVTRMFSDSVFGGKEGARRAARKFRKEQMGELPERQFRGGEPLAAGGGGSGRTGGKSSGQTAAGRAGGGAKQRSGSKRRSRGGAKTARARSKAAVHSRKPMRRGGRR